ncbi:MAG: hypothetical protein OXT09_08300 [Myxococcales bacterium]|nr:hypothetical protein [Myxococcales bacterium]
MKTIKIDGVEYDPTTPEFAEAAAKFQERADANAKALEQAKAKIARAKARADAAEKKTEELQEKLDAVTSPEAIDEGVKARAELIATAAKFLPEGTELVERSDAEIRKMVVRNNLKSLSLAGKDAAYIAAAYEAVVARGPQSSSRAPKTDRGAVGALRRDTHVRVNGHSSIRFDRITLPIKIN